MFLYLFDVFKKRSMVSIWTFFRFIIKLLYCYILTKCVRITKNHNNTVHNDPYECKTLKIILCNVLCSSQIGITARRESFINKQNLQWAMNEVCTLRENRELTPPSVALDSTQLLHDSYPFELPVRRSTLRALIDEFRRVEHQHRSDGDTVGGDEVAGKIWSPATIVGGGGHSVHGQLFFKKTQQPSQSSASSTTPMRKSSSVWYATPPVMNAKPHLVTRMSMPNLVKSHTNGFQEKQDTDDKTHNE